MDRSRYTELLERAKAESDRRVKAIFDGVNTFVILALIDGAVVEINRSALTFRNLKREEVTGSPLWDGPWLADDAETAARMMTAMETAAMGEPAEFDAVMTDCDGAPRRFSVACQPVSDGGGGVAYVLIEAHDMTEFLRMQNRSRELELEMMHNQKLESLGTLASGVAHEINTPMQYIRDNLDFLAGGFDSLLSLLRDAKSIAQAAQNVDLPPALAAQLAEWRARAAEADLDFIADETPQAIRQSSEGVDRVCDIVRAIKLFSHPDSADKAPESLEKLVLNTLTVSRNQWKYVAEVDTDFSPDIPPVHCHGGEISQVVLNLVVNAMHAIEDKASKTGQAGRITITGRVEGDNAVLTVTDDGAGIDPRNYGKLFDLFFTTKEPGRGTGHGLSICHTIVTRKHGGTLNFRSELGVGTSFIVTLPIKPNPATEIDDAAPAQGN